VIAQTSASAAPPSSADVQADGYHVTAPQFPLTAQADDVARLRQVLDLQDGPTVVAGHSYGGQIIIALGADAPNVAGLVYIAAFGLDQGESLGALLSQGPVTPALAHLFTAAFLVPGRRRRRGAAA
jgi:pimeloyl-ACP methyl ester carboxylesterase